MLMLILLLMMIVNTYVTFTLCQELHSVMDIYDIIYWSQQPWKVDVEKEKEI